MKALGIVLVVLGIIGLVYGGISWTKRETIVNAGPIKITAEDRDSIPLPPIAGGLMLVAGAVLLMKKS